MRKGAKYAQQTEESLGDIHVEGCKHEMCCDKRKRSSRGQECNRMVQLRKIIPLTESFEVLQKIFLI